MLASYNLEDWEEKQRAVRLALDTSVHGMGQYPQLVGSDLKTKAEDADEEMQDSSPDSPSSPTDDKACEPCSGVNKFAQFEAQLAMADKSTSKEVWKEQLLIPF